jgi:hypothetical protein
LSNTLPDNNEAPVHLRSSAQLSVRAGEQGPAAEAAAPAAPAPASTQDESLPVPAVAATGLALLLAGGWILQRRQRLAQGAPLPADPPSPEAAVRPEPQSEPRPEPEPQAEAATHQAPEPEPEAVAVSEPGPVPAPAVAATSGMMAQVAEELAGEPEDLQPRQTFPAPLERSHAPPRLLGVRAQKRLIKWLMRLRTMAGGVAILAAIAVVVFWAIEAIDHRSGETGLTRPLLVLLAVGWAAFWGSGMLANHLHRVFFGRVHPKFDT